MYNQQQPQQQQPSPYNQQQYPPQYPPQQPYPPQQQQQQQYPPPQGQYNQYPPQQQYQNSQYETQSQQQLPPQNYVHDDKTIPKDPFLAQADDPMGLNALSFDERKGFIVKVYSLLTFQLFITFLFCLIAYFSQGFRDFLVNPENNQFRAFSWVCFAISFITEIAIFCCKGVAKKVPQNYIALSIFTFTFSIVIAATCGTCYGAFTNGGILVVIAATMTMGVTLALTAYACTTKTDITMKGGALFIMAMVLLLCSIFSIFIHSAILAIFICGLAIVIYGFYLIYDTQLIMGGKTHELSIDDYVIATMIIYIDIIILFLRILQILMILFGKK